MGVVNQALGSSLQQKKNEGEDVLVKETTRLSIEGEWKPAATDAAFDYTKEETEAIQSVYDKLVTTHEVDPKRIGLRALALTTIVSKLRVDEAAEKYIKLSKAVETCNVLSLSSSDDQIEEMMNDEKIVAEFAAYAPCGTDSEKRQIMWIKGRGEFGPPPEREAASTEAGILYWLAVHADSTSLREGITLVIDTSGKTSMTKHGNEGKLQKRDQSYPSRPQSIMIAGASLPKRTVINGLIKVASLFTKQKILQRIKFASVQQAYESVPEASAPRYLGGGAGGIDDVQVWVKQRLSSFPIPAIRSME